MAYNRKAWAKTQDRLGDVLWKVAWQTRHGFYNGYVIEILELRLKWIKRITVIDIALIFVMDWANRTNECILLAIFAMPLIYYGVFLTFDINRYHRYGMHDCIPDEGDA